MQTEFYILSDLLVDVRKPKINEMGEQMDGWTDRAIHMFPSNSVGGWQLPEKERNLNFYTFIWYSVIPAEMCIYEWQVSNVTEDFSFIWLNISKENVAITSNTYSIVSSQGTLFA